MKTIAVLTATRAEYGLLSPIIKALRACPEFCIKVVVTGAHLSPEFGLTYREIEADGIEIDRKIESLMSADTPSAISKSMGMTMIGFADYFAQSAPDALMVLGDRYETLAVCCAAMNAGIPIIHLYGGETTQGAVDEAIRHAITKLSFLHLTSTEEYRKRVIQLGEAPDRVFTVGAIGVENAMKQPLLARKELEKKTGLLLEDPYAVVTFHPVTLECGSAERQCQELLDALDEYPELGLILTKANADSEGRVINRLMEKYAAGRKNAVLVDSLGMQTYLSALKYAGMVVGNSSSGLIEAPSFGIPTVNIGDRQKGRLRGESVIDCKPDKADICRALEKARSEEFLKQCKEGRNPYGDSHVSERIVKVIQDIILAKPVELMKEFYDL